MSEPLEETLRRLKEERDVADRRYNDALTALDESLQPAGSLGAGPPPYDEHPITPLNEAWNILTSPPAPRTGLAGRLSGFVWRTVAPFLERQLTFNSRLVDHLNRNASAHRDAHRMLQQAVVTLNGHAAAQAEFHNRLLLLLQQITPYVDTKDRDSAGATLVLNASLSAMGDRLAKHAESMAIRESRYEARTSALAGAYQDLQAMVGVAQQAALTAKREIERLREAADAGGGRELTRQSGDEPDTVHGALNAYKYVGFENEFRGSREAIRQRLESYLPYFEGASEVLDVGCGRGEFLDLMAGKGITARGLDMNHEMVEECRARGLQVVEGDAVTMLESLPDGALGGVFAAQVVEHLEPSYLLRFLELAFHKMRRGSYIVLETLNPACWVAFFESYIRDITHRWPLHPETLKYLVMASGFIEPAIEWRSPVPQHDRLQPVRVGDSADPLLSDLVEVFNANVEKLNSRIFTHLDYAIVGRKGQRAVDE